MAGGNDTLRTDLGHRGGKLGTSPRDGPAASKIRTLYPTILCANVRPCAAVSPWATPSSAGVPATPASVPIGGLRYKLTSPYPIGPDPSIPRKPSTSPIALGALPRSAEVLDHLASQPVVVLAADTPEP